MATKSTTKRSSTISRSRSLSRMNPESEPDYIKNVPRGKFVNTERGSATAEINSLDDLAMELFSSSSLNDGRLANDTSSSSRRRGRSRGDDSSILSPISSSRRRRSLSTSQSRRNNKDIDGYSSALTDEESRDTRITQNGFEKIIRTVYTRNKVDNNTTDEEMASGEMYEDKAKHDILAAVMFEEQQCSMAKNSRAVARPSRGRKSMVSKNLIEEADQIIEDFVSSVEDTDISSFDGERSDCSSSIGGIIKSRNAVFIREEAAEFYKSPDSCVAEMDGVILPWLQWETSGDGSHLSRNNVTPKALKWDSEKEAVMLHDPSSYSISSYGSWSPASKSTLVSNNSSSFDMEEYLRLENDENVLFQMYGKRNRISSGGLLLCRSGFV